MNLYVIFDAIVKSGSYSKAAEELNYTPSAISHAISRLEQQLGGSRLLFRTKTGVELTPLGREVHFYVRKILENENYLRSLPLKYAEEKHKTIYLGFPTCLSHVWLPPFMNKFCAAFPDLTLIANEYSCQISYSSVQVSKNDLPIVVGPIEEHTHFQEHELLFSDPLVCITPADYTPKNGAFMKYSEMKCVPLIEPEPLYDHSLCYLFMKHGQIISNCRTRTGDLHAILSLVSMGQGISIMPGVAVRGYRHSGNYRIYPIEGNPVRRICLLKTPGHAENPYLALCAELLHRHTAEYASECVGE